MGKLKIYAFEMSRISEVYLSTLSTIMKPHGIERFFIPLIYLTENKGEITQTELAKAIRRDKVFTMRVVDYLCDRDLLIRKKDCIDRRCQILEVTANGKALVPFIKEGIAKTDALLFHNFSKAEKELFKGSIDKLYATLSTLPDPEFIVSCT